MGPEARPTCLSIADASPAALNPRARDSADTAPTIKILGFLADIPSMQGPISCRFCACLLAAVLAVTAAPVSAAENAADFGAGVAAYKAGDFAAAHQQFKVLALDGDPRGQFALALMFDNGEGVSQNDKEARRWYAKSAAQGFAKAQFNLALMLEKGRGGSPDEAAARQWFARSAAAGNRDAVDRVHEYAADGDPAMNRELGRLYHHGRGVPRNPGEARRYLEIAAEAGDTEAMFYLAVHLTAEAGEGPLPDAARQWYERAASAGHAGAAYNLATLLRAGVDVRPDPERAQALYVTAAEAGHAHAALALGMLFEQGGPWPSDPARARYWYQRAAELGAADALVNLAAIEADRPPAARDLDEVERLLEAAARQGHPLARPGLDALAALRAGTVSPAPDS